MSKTKYQAWKGFFTDYYFNHLEREEWVNISYWKYFKLKLLGYEVRKIKKVKNQQKLKIILLMLNSITPIVCMVQQYRTKITTTKINTNY